MYESCFTEKTKTPSIAGETSAEKKSSVCSRKQSRQEQKKRNTKNTKRRFHAVNIASRLGFNCRKNCGHGELTDAGKAIRDALKQKKTAFTAI